jgi:hypothetical protein
MNLKSSRINSQVRVKVHTEDCGSRGSINADQARTYAQIAEAEAKKAKYYADLIEENVKVFADKNYVHEQNIAEKTWRVTHSLNKYPTVTVIDSAGNEVICNIEHIDTNNCIISMNAPFKGKAIFN